jgi:hypothetical protein
METPEKIKSNCCVFFFNFCFVLVLQKMKEVLKEDLRNLDKVTAQLSNIVENQENLMNNLLNQLVVHLSLLVRSFYPFP